MSEKARIRRLERDVERLEAVVYTLAERHCRGVSGHVWWPRSGPLAALRRKVGR